ncbi:MAG: tyrosine--tRNA ligase [Nanoarchaeota archaeon]
MTLEDQLNEFRRGTVDILTEEELVRKLKQNRPLNVKFGVDPTAPDIHLGHTVPLQKLKQFQDLGHNVQLIIGDYTAMIGDPSGRNETRPTLTREEIEDNMETYQKQVFKVLDSNKTSLVYNSQWLEEFSGTDVIKLGSKYTVQQLLQRRDFGERIKQNRPLSVTELLYPLLVGYDSVHLKSDVEIGGTDQLFNFMASREIQKAYGQEPEIIITLPLLEGVDGVKKMSKSFGNAIGVNDDPNDMYGKIMSISDDLMLKYYELLSETSLEEFQKIREAISSGSVNPMEYKQRLAREIVSRYHEQNLALSAEERFNYVHRRKNVPEKLEEQVIKYSTSEEELSIVKVLRQMGRINSNSEARRLIEQGGVRLDGETINDMNYVVSPQDGQVVQIGKRYFRKLKYEKE